MELGIGFPLRGHGVGESEVLRCKRRVISRRCVPSGVYGAFGGLEEQSYWSSV